MLMRSWNKVEETKNLKTIAQLSKYHWISKANSSLPYLDTRRRNVMQGVVWNMNMIANNSTQGESWKKGKNISQAPVVCCSECCCLYTDALKFATFSCIKFRRNEFEAAPCLREPVFVSYKLKKDTSRLSLYLYPKVKHRYPYNRTIKQKYNFPRSTVPSVLQSSPKQPRSLPK